MSVCILNKKSGYCFILISHKNLRKKCKIHTHYSKKITHYFLVNHKIFIVKKSGAYMMQYNMLKSKKQILTHAILTYLNRILTEF